MRRSLLAPILFALLAAPAALAQGDATYGVTFEADWSAATHPDGFPPNPHFSGLVGATHDATTSLWAPGKLASPGIEVMAETGGKSTLLAEVNALIADGRAATALSGSGVGLSPGSVSMTFEVAETHPLVSLVTMIAPSPDWFVGVRDLDLRDEDGEEGWADEITVTLFAYDAGTDSGPNYTSSNQDTNPQEPVFLIEESPFVVDGKLEPIGTFTFNRIPPASTDDGSTSAATFALAPPAPNPAVERAAVTLRLGTPQPVRVEVFDVLGRRVATLYDGVLAAGTHPFAVDAGALRSGMYVVRARSATASATRRLTVAR